MDSEDFIDLHSSIDSVIETEKNESNICTSEPESDSQPNTSDLKEDIIDEENSGNGISDGEIEDGQLVQTMEIDNDLVKKAPILQEGFQLVESIEIVEKVNGVSSAVDKENGFAISPDDSTISNRTIDESPKSGVKRARMTYVDQEPSVHVVYNSLTSASKRKLEELLQQWSQWHAQHNLLTKDPNETLESGEQTFFPALHFGQEKASTVSFWMDNQTRKKENNYIPLDGDSVPLYDREYALGLTSADGSTNLEGGLEKLEASRCFNCGSYNHSLKDCRKPRDNVAVDNARKQHSSKRTQTAGSRNSPRYYQNSPGGKYDGLRPGVLGSETRQLLGLGELDPPPWLWRMREIGYPPGYLDPEYEDQPSGITIYGDEKTKEGQEDGEILETNKSELKKKMSVEFPGINAAIPENADEKRWASLPEASSFDSSRNRLHPIPNRLSEAINKGNYSEPRRSRDYRDDGPPGCNIGVDPSMFSHSPRYSSYDPNASESYSPRGIPIPRSPSLGRSLSDRGRWSPLVHDGSPSSYSPVSYASPSTQHSPRSYSSANPESWSYGSRHNLSSSSQRKDKHDHHRHRRM